ncbi:MFS transporter [Glycomyces terrestris]|uniref:MFS transporter n=1 Tax=Glycomyces terrestris TaxID=2493553 RepID=A0A426UV00_9ACTN|nr:MFS transporter [Glycomyces terrestris]RRR98142.1 MFS transporter [Glycomyces terrestris]
MASTTLAAPHAPAGTRAVLAILCAAPLLVILNYSTPLILAPQTAAQLHASAAGQTWIINAVSLGLAVPLLASGSLADNHGRRRVLTAGAWIFAAATLLAALAPNTPVFAAARIVQGAASAALLTASLGIMGAVFTGAEERRRATAAYGAMMGLGVGAGAVLAALLEAALGWNGPYWLYAAAAAGLALAARTALPESRAERPRRADLPGTAALGLAVAALMAGLTLGRQGWSDPLVIALLIAAAVGSTAFVAIQVRSREPMLDPALFARPAFLTASLGALVTGVAVISMMSYLPTVYQAQTHLGPIATAAVVAIWSTAAFVVSLQVKRFALGAGALLALALLTAAAGSALLVGLAVHWSWWHAVPALLVAGAGYGAANPALTRLSIDSVPADRGGMGSGVNNTMRYIGTAAGIPIIATLVDALGADGALWICAALAAAAAPGFALLARRA